MAGVLPAVWWTRVFRPAQILNAFPRNRLISVFILYAKRPKNTIKISNSYENHLAYTRVPVPPYVVLFHTLFLIDTHFPKSMPLPFADGLRHGSHGAKGTPASGLKQNHHNQAYQGRCQHQAIEAEAELSNPIRYHACRICPAPGLSLIHI